MTEGEALTSQPPPAPRPLHWGGALVILILSQWTLRQGEALFGVLFQWLVLPTRVIDMTAPPEAGAWLLASQTLSFAILAAAVIVGARIWAALPPTAIGLNLRALHDSHRWVIAGLAAALPTIVPLFELPSGWMTELARALPLLTPAILIQSATEEILFRGLLLGLLAARYGPLRGALISAALFGAWHIYIGQPWLDLIFRFATTFVFGVTSAMLVLKQGHLGGAIALHMIWNLTLAVTSGLQDWPTISFWQALNGYYYGLPLYEWNSTYVGAILLPLVIESILVFAFTRDLIVELLSPNQNRNNFA